MNETNNNWFEQNSRKIILIVLFCFILGLEGGIRLLVHLGVVQYQHYPTRADLSKPPEFLDDIHESFGVWHYANARSQQKSPCFDVENISNAFGMRDKPREISAAVPGGRRVVVLGDSYVEGYGIRQGERVTDLLEKWTGIEHLNFGTSGSFGSVQEWLLYRDLASGFEHSDVFVFLLPFNDLSDNDPSEFPANRYRPYLQKKNEEWQVTYPIPFAERFAYRRDLSMPLIESLRNSFNNTVYLANFFRMSIRVFRKKIGLDDLPPDLPATYNNYSEQALEVLLKSYEGIIEVAKGRQVFLFSIPVDRDYMYYARHGYNFKLVDALKKFADRHANVTFVDLLPGILARLERDGNNFKVLQNNCDGHWNPYGNEVVAQVVRSVVFNKNRHQ